MVALLKLTQINECPYKEDCLTRKGFERERFGLVKEFDLRLCNTYFEECGRYIKIQKLEIK